MSRTKRKSSNGNAREAWRDRLHVVDFSYEDELTISEWFASTKPDPFSCLAELVDSGWSVRVTPPQKGDDFWCSATYKSEGRDYTGHTYSTKYPDLEIAIILAYYAITAMLADGRLNGTLSPGGRAWLK